MKQDFQDTFYVENMIQEFDSLHLILVTLMMLVKMAMMTILMQMFFIYDDEVGPFTGQLNEDMVSTFIVGTCQLIPRTSSFVYSDYMLNLSPSKHSGYEVVCGSSAEFFIRPIVSCVDDMDLLIAETDQLVFSGESPVLPVDLNGLPDKIKCHKIEQYEGYPGFVRLKCWGFVNYN